MYVTQILVTFQLNYFVLIFGIVFFFFHSLVTLKWIRCWCVCVWGISIGISIVQNLHRSSNAIAFPPLLDCTERNCSVYTNLLCSVYKDFICTSIILFCWIYWFCKSAPVFSLCVAPAVFHFYASRGRIRAACLEAFAFDSIFCSQSYCRLFAYCPIRDNC